MEKLRKIAALYWNNLITFEEAKLLILLAFPEHAEEYSEEYLHS
jgi:hypothetical protein